MSKNTSDMWADAFDQVFGDEARIGKWIFSAKFTPDYTPLKELTLENRDTAKSFTWNVDNREMTYILCLAQLYHAKEQTG